MCTKASRNNRHSREGGNPACGRDWIPAFAEMTQQGLVEAIKQRQRGVSLIEAVLFIVVVSIALVVVLKAFDIANQGSADPVLRRQSLAIAQSLLDEISFKPFGSAATDDVAQGGFAGPYTSANRQWFDDVDDYNDFAMDDGIRSLDNTALTALGNYQARVAVVAAAFGAVPASAGYRITVTVTDPSGAQLALEGYRANY